MRIAALYDIHGNLPALEAVLDEVVREYVDLIVFGGDAVMGPMPRETLAGLLRLDVPTTFITGNCERQMLAMLDGHEPTTVPASLRELLRWTGEQLMPAQITEIRQWPATERVTVPGLGDVLFCHATPRNDTEIFLKTTAEDLLAPILAPTGAALVVCGHTHMPFDRTVAGIRVVNAGSVGMSFAGPGACWLLIDGPRVELRRTAYDLDAADVRIRASNYPQAEDFAANNVLNPPLEAAMLDRFRAAELR